MQPNQHPQIPNTPNTHSVQRPQTVEGGQDVRPPEQLNAMLQADPDFVDKVFEYLLAEFPEIAGPKFGDVKRALRGELGGERVYVSSRSASDRQQLARKVLALFNGRNATEVARSLNISRATVYRVLKQPHGAGQ